MAYIIDSDVFIRAKNDHYGFGFCPGFWDWMLEEHAAGRLYSVEQVRGELYEQEDELTEWARNTGSDLFTPTPPDVWPFLQQVSDWSQSGAYEPGAVQGFMQAADYYLVGRGLARGDTVVTHEVPARSRRKIKIPDACIGVQVRVISPFEMLRESRARLVLGR